MTYALHNDYMRLSSVPYPSLPPEQRHNTVRFGC